MPDDPDANIMTGTGSTTTEVAGNSNSSSQQQLKVKSNIDLKISPATPAQINLPPLRPLEGAVETNGKAGNGSSSNGDMNDSLVISRKVKNCPELPPGNVKSTYTMG